MADFKILRIRFRWKGNWASSTAYIKDDIVRYGGKTYVALKTHTSASNFYTDFNAVDAQIPPQPDPFWELMLDGFAWTSNWQPSTFYGVGDLIKKNGIVYICVEEHTSVSSDTNFTDDLDDSYWIVHTATDNWRYNWNTDVLYSLNDIVKYNGIIYRCIEAHVSANTVALGLEDDQAKWEVLSDTTYWRGNWSTNTRYRVNDTVRYNGLVYFCNQGHTSSSSITSGLENDLSKWTLFYRNIEYRGTWNSSSVRYKLNDVVKYGAGLYICITHHTSSTSFDESKWQLYVPGFQFDNEWNDTTVYQPGDVVSYGGYDYYALTNNVNQKPSVQSDDWELLKTSFKIRGDWNSAVAYKVGDVVRRGGMLYVAIADSIDQETTLTQFWELLIPGIRWQGRWESAQEYLLGDVVTFISSAYKCILKHTSAVETRPDNDITNSYWQLLIEGDTNNVLYEEGDIRTYGVAEDGSTIGVTRREIGIQGEVLKTVDGELRWEKLNQTPKVFYVATDGDDNNTGDSLNAPWKTVRHACQNVTGPATIFIKTGTYREQLPISVSAEVALVGDELRGTTIEPLPGFETSNMFYVRNATGIRNMTLKGLTGTLGPPNLFGTRRPSAGAYVSLDPGANTLDSSVWITTRSPYIQNVTTFGDGCIGLKIDGSLHAGGNRSIVANDFTQILSDGIGIWCTNLALTELVSVFTYYSHIGYLAENGGKVRATNGNNSYGDYGSVAEGFDQSEVPITGNVNNRSLEAQIGSVITHPGPIYAVEYTNAGSNYTSATFSFAGAGINASAVGNEIRDGSIYQARIVTPGDSSAPGGGSYLTVLNNAQSGTSSLIVLSASDQNTASNYVGMRIILTSGTGAGQYGYISDYDSLTKTALVTRETDDQQGWDHVIGGYPIEALLNTTTVYRIEPRVTFSSPGYSRFARTLPAVQDWKDIVWGNGAYVAIAANNNQTARSTNGTVWALGGSLPSASNWVAISTGSISSSIYHVAVSLGSTAAAYSVDAGTNWLSSTLPTGANWSSVAYGDSRFIAVASGGTNTAVTTNGTSWISSTALPSTQAWSSIAYGNNVWVAVAAASSICAYSTDNGTTWISVTLPYTDNWVSVTYGNNRFVAICENSVSSAYSFDGVVWYASSLPVSLGWKKVRYGQGTFLAVASGSNQVARSTNGFQWTNIGDDSTLLTLPSSSTWEAVAFGNPNNNGVWVAAANATNSAASILTGTKAFARATVASGRIGKISFIEPGSGYITTPIITVFDPNKTSNVFVRLRVGNGALAQPTFANRGTGYVSPTTTVTVNGDGFADQHQIGQNLVLSNLTFLPGPGDNLNINGINDVTYRIITVTTLGGSTGNFSVRLRISPTLDIEESPEHSAAVTIRQKYSQIRLTGHDFLDIGAGNFQNANYPNIPLLELAPENEVAQSNGGRVFYTSTDQDGNFRVGELFRVEQSTGIVTVSADLFDLTGLTELSLGGVSVGGTGVVIREFSTDSTFTADSNNIIPTQRAIKAYLTSRISGGGASAVTTILTAGVVRIGPQSISTTTGFQIEVPVKMNITKGIDGNMLQLQFFLRS